MSLRGAVAKAEAVEKKEREIADLKRALDTALRNLAKAKASKDDLVAAVYRAARDGISAMEIPAIPPPPKDPRRDSEEVAIAVLSDWQLAKVTPDYNSKVCEQRIKKYADKVIELTEIQRAHHPVKELRVWLLGDLVEGELIFSGQSHLIDASLYRQVTVDGPRILLGFLRRMLSYFERVKVVGVIGNHGSLGGRARREYSPESNADRMLMQICRLVMEEGGEKRISWNIPDGPGERKWYALDYIGRHGFLLCHGDQFRWGVKTPSTEAKVLGWRTGAIPLPPEFSEVREPFQEVVCGHHHNINLISLRGGTTMLRVNGATESYNVFAQEVIGSMSRPVQWLLFGHEKHGITTERRVWLD